ncbi:hypothetical protein D3C85_1582560 [compost metagenome]
MNFTRPLFICPLRNHSMATRKCPSTLAASMIFTSNKVPNDERRGVSSSGT